MPLINGMLREVRRVCTARPILTPPSCARPSLPNFEAFRLTDIRAGYPTLLFGQGDMSIRPRNIGNTAT